MLEPPLENNAEGIRSDRATIPGKKGKPLIQNNKLKYQFTGGHLKLSSH